MFYIAVCDDMENERELTVSMITEFFRDANIEFKIDEYRSSEALTAEFADGNAFYDLIFMDIFMEGLNGFEASVKIRKYDKSVAIVFLTKSPDFAIESYEVEASGYLLKPADDKKLSLLLSKLTRTERPKSIAIKKRGKVKTFDYRDIVYAESHAHTLTVHLTGGREDSIYYKLDDFEDELNDERFLRCHKSYLVNMDFVKHAEEVFTLTTGSKVPIRSRGRKEIINSYTRHLGQL